MISRAKKSAAAPDLRGRLKGIIILAGVGNAFRSDDAAGPRLIEMLSERLHEASNTLPSVHLINCRETPENHVRALTRLHPQTIVVIDSAHLGLTPGAIRLIETDSLAGLSSSTHMISPALFMNRLKEETGADVFLIAIQPATVSFGESLSPPVSQALTQLTELFYRLLTASRSEEVLSPDHVSG